MKNKIFYLLVLIAVGLLLYFAFRPTPVSVETATIVRGPLQVTIDEEGETRAHDRFIITAPVAGRLSRIELHDGDPVHKDEVVALLNPLPLDMKQRDEVIARVRSAESSKQEAEERAAHASSDYEQAKRERLRIEKLNADGFASRQTLEQAKNTESTAANELAAAQFKIQAASAEVEIAKAGMIALQPGNQEKLIRLRSPADGYVLRIVEKSEHVVSSGTNLMVIGDEKNLEVVLDLLSSDAVKVKPGDIVYLENWGGEKQLRAKVRVVEPYAFTKISALGIEEQRVNVVADFIDPPESLGDGYRVEGRIVIWNSHSVLKAPSNALFRQGDSWNVFIVENGIARRREIKIGHRNPLEVEILSGIREAEEIILHPSNEIHDGIHVRSKR